MSRGILVVGVVFVVSGCRTTPETSLYSWGRTEPGKDRGTLVCYVECYGSVPIAAVVLRYVPGEQDEPAFVLDDHGYSRDGIYTYTRIDGVSIVPAETYGAILSGRAEEVCSGGRFVVYVNGAYGEPVRITLPPSVVDEFFQPLLGAMEKREQLELMRRFWDTYVVPLTRTAPESPAPGDVRTLETKYLVDRTRPPRTPFARWVDELPRVRFFVEEVH